MLAAVGTDVPKLGKQSRTISPSECGKQQGLVPSHAMHLLLEPFSVHVVVKSICVSVRNLAVFRFPLPILPTVYKLGLDSVSSGFVAADQCRPIFARDGNAVTVVSSLSHSSK